MSQPLRVMLDTNVYEFLATVEAELIPKIIVSEKVKVYGCRLVRRQLRDTPKNKMAGTIKLRINMLSVYDLLVKHRDIEAGSLANYLATEYLAGYAGNISAQEMASDFLIVAICAIKGLDIVCTHDFRTMASDAAKKTYERVNNANSLKTPRFIKLEELKRLI